MPGSIVKIKKCHRIILEMNPFRSPTQDLLQEGIDSIFDYYYIRNCRLCEMEKKLKAAGRYIASTLSMYAAPVNST